LTWLALAVVLAIMPPWSNRNAGCSPTASATRPMPKPSDARCSPSAPASQTSVPAPASSPSCASGPERAASGAATATPGW